MADYAIIRDFSPSEDFLQLRRSALYVTGSVPQGLPAGTALFLDNDGVAGLSANDELIAILEGVASTVNLASRFSLV